MDGSWEGEMESKEEFLRMGKITVCLHAVGNDQQRERKMMMQERKGSIASVMPLSKEEGLEFREQGGDCPQLGS